MAEPPSPAFLADSDQRCAEAEREARIIAAFYTASVTAGLPAAMARVLTYNYAGVDTDLLDAADYYESHDEEGEDP